MTIRASLVYALLFATGIAVQATSIAARRNGNDDNSDNFIAGHGDGGRGDADDYFNDFGTNSASQPQQLTQADLKNFRTINWEKAVNIRYAHAALASLAFLFFFPIGAIIIRVIPGKAGVYLHALMQFFAYCVFIAATGMGIWLATYVRFTYYDLVSLLLSSRLISSLTLQPVQKLPSNHWSCGLLSSVLPAFHRYYSSSRIQTPW
jgi:hypothetical protein